jgi:hypothetical protein
MEARTRCWFAFGPMDSPAGANVKRHLWFQSQTGRPPRPRQQHTVATHETAPDERADVLADGRMVDRQVALILRQHRPTARSAQKCA